VHCAALIFAIVWLLNPLRLDRHLSQADRLSSKGVSREARRREQLASAAMVRDFQDFHSSA